MLSRVADSVFWMSRYVERAENVARFIDVNNNLALNFGEELDEQWAPMVLTSGDYAAFERKYGHVTRENVLEFLAFDRDNPNAIVSCLRKARENARAIRENLSTAMWEELNKFYLMVQAARREEVLDDPYEFLKQVRLASHLLVGITETTMAHGEAWHFSRMGRLLERADKTSRILDVKYFILLPEPADVGTPLDIVQWSALLRSTSALAMYRRVFGRIAPEKVAQFLILDRHFPRSIRFCLVNAQESLHAITGAPVGTFRTAAEQRLGRLRAGMDYASIDEIITEGMHEFVDRFQTQLNEVDISIDECFFSVEYADAAPPAAQGILQ